MEEIESAEALKHGAPVLIVTTATDLEPSHKYMGFLTGLDDIFLSAKISHEEQMVEPFVIPESREEVKELLRKRPTWQLLVRAMVKYRMPLFGKSREELVEMLTEWMEGMAIEKMGRQPSMVEYPLPRHMSLALGSIERLEYVGDLADTAVLVGLDFEPELPEGEPKAD